MPARNAWQRGTQLAVSHRRYRAANLSQEGKAKQGLIRGDFRERRTALPSPSANLAGERWSGSSRDHPDNCEMNHAPPGARARACAKYGNADGRWCVLRAGLRGKSFHQTCWFPRRNVRANSNGGMLGRCSMGTGEPVVFTCWAWRCNTPSMPASGMWRGFVRWWRR